MIIHGYMSDIVKLLSKNKKYIPNDILQCLLKYCNFIPCFKNRIELQESLTFTDIRNAELVAKQLGASEYMECSAYSKEGLKEVLETAGRIAMGTYNNKKTKKNKKNKQTNNNDKKCILM